MPSMQSVIAALLVSGCSLYAIWTLMPATARRSAAATLLRLPLPRALSARLRVAAQATSGCDCSGCDRAEKKPVGPTGPTEATTQTGTAHRITFHRRPPH